MARQLRFFAQGLCYHVVQRGHNRSAVFSRDEDRFYYLSRLAGLCTTLECQLLSYCLMTNHVHLLFGSDNSQRISRLMKNLSGPFSQRINRIAGRSGAYWDQRFKSSPVEDETHLLLCSRYVELNPVRANIVAAPEDYRWSSLREKCGRAPRYLVHEDPFYLSFGPNRPAREREYLRWVKAGNTQTELARIREAVSRGKALGSRRFCAEVREKLQAGRRQQDAGDAAPEV